jgi:hypothetical protein
MSRSIEIIVAPTGEIRIDAVNFKGADCEQATRFLEEALGTAGARQRKPEYHQRQHTRSQQKLGG